MEMEVIDFVHYPVAFSYPWLAGKKNVMSPDNQTGWMGIQITEIDSAHRLCFGIAFVIHSYSGTEGCN